MTMEFYIKLLLMGNHSFSLFLYFCYLSKWAHDPPVYNWKIYIISLMMDGSIQLIDGGVEIGPTGVCRVHRAGHSLSRPVLKLPMLTRFMSQSCRCLQYV